MEVPPMTRTEAVKEFFQEGSFARRHRRAAVLHFQIRLHQEWRAGSSLALDTLRPAFGIHRMCVWIVPGGDSLGGGAALFGSELRDRRHHRRLRPGVAPCWWRHGMCPSPSTA